MLYLEVPFKEKDAAKRLGARWDPNMKKWYVEKRFDYPKFAKWILKDEVETTIICDHVYVVEGQRKCYKCGETTPVITFGIEKFCRIWNQEEFGTSDYFEWNDGEVRITPDIPDIDDMIDYFYSYLYTYYNYHLGYSRTAGASYMANHCLCCDSLQGDYYINQEVDSPFFVDSPEKARKLTLRRIELPYDKVMDIGINWSSADWMIKQFAVIKEIDWK